MLSAHTSEEVQQKREKSTAWRCCFVGVYIFVLQKKIKPNNTAFLSVCREKKKKSMHSLEQRHHSRPGYVHKWLVKGRTSVSGLDLLIPLQYISYSTVLCCFLKNNVARSKMTPPTTTAAQVVPLIKVQARRNVRLATKTHKHNFVIFRRSRIIHNLWWPAAKTGAGLALAWGIFVYSQ